MSLICCAGRHCNGLHQREIRLDWPAPPTVYPGAWCTCGFLTSVTAPCPVHGGSYYGTTTTIRLSGGTDA